METHYCIGSCQSKWVDSLTGVAKFTADEWDGAKIKSSHSVELHVRFNPSTKKWEIVEQKEWEGRF